MRVEAAGNDVDHRARSKRPRAKRLSAKFHIALGQTFLLVSLILLALFLGLVPDRHSAIREGRGALAEAIAANSSTLISQTDIQRLDGILRLVVARNADLLSAAVRRENGEAVVTIGDHDDHWRDISGEYSTDSQLQVPIWSGDQKWGRVELRYRPLAIPGWRGFIGDPRVQLIAFLALSAFAMFYLYLSKMLRHLDPSQAVPEHVRSALDTMVEGLLVIDREGHIAMANRAFASIVGQAPDDLVGLQASDFSWSTSDGLPVARDAFPWIKALREGSPQKNAMLYLLDNESKRRTFMVNCSPVLGSGGTHGGALISFDDVTQLEEKEIELRKSKEEAELANRAKSDFLANMSHEIRTPMNAILGFAEMLRRGYSKSERERKKYVNTIYSSGKHLLELINGILDLSKVESGRLEVERIRFAPHAVVHEVVQALSVRAREKSVSLGFEVDGAIPETILSDPERMRQIVTNLVGNAIKFTEEGGVKIIVRIESSREQPQLSIEVVDSGIGMPEETLETIFDPFVQADASITRRFGGTGLGLAISRRFAQALGGDISVSSEQGKGSVFTVTIDAGPLDGIKLLEPDQVLAIGEDTVSDDQVHWVFPPSRVLVVDDGEENRELVTLILEEVGLRVDGAENGKIGMEKALQEEFDVVLMDMQMPVMDGEEATRRLRRQGYETPIIALTAHAMKGFEQAIMAAGCSGYLTKPIDIDMLLQTVADLLGGQQVDRDKDETVPTTLFDDRLERDSITQPPLISRLPGDDARFRAIIVKFAGRLDGQLEAMETAWQEKNFEELANLAHWLKGAAGTVGFDAFTEPAADLEQLAKAGCEDQIETAISDLRRLVSRVHVPSDEDEPVAAQL